MAFRFRKSIKLAPGVKLNLGKKSVGVSVGGKYGGVSYNSRNGARYRPVLFHQPEIRRKGRPGSRSRGEAEKALL